jgi:transposase
VSKRYIVDLSDEERAKLRGLVSKGKLAARKLNRAHVLLAADEGACDEAIAKTLQISVATVERTRRRFVEGGLEHALNEKPRPGARPRLDDRGQAYLIATACSSPPEGRRVWTMQLLADRLVRLEVVESISDETVRQALKRGSSSPGSERNGVFRV